MQKIQKQNVLQVVKANPYEGWIDLGINTTSTGKSGLFLNPANFDGANLYVEEGFAALLIGRAGANIRKVSEKLGKNLKVNVCKNTSDLSRDEELRESTGLDEFDFSSKVHQFLKEIGLDSGIQISAESYLDLRKQIQEGALL